VSRQPRKFGEVDNVAVNSSDGLRFAYQCLSGKWPVDPRQRERQILGTTMLNDDIGWYRESTQKERSRYLNELLYAVQISALFLSEILHIP